MEFSIKALSPESAKSGCVVLGVHAERELTPAAKRVDQASRGALKKALGMTPDAVIDTGVPVEDAVVWVEGQNRPLGGSSTVIASVVSHEIISRTGMIMASRGEQLQTFVSPTVEGASVSSNDEVFAEHARYLHAAQARTLPR